MELGTAKISPLPMPEHNVVPFKAQTIATVIKQLRQTQTQPLFGHPRPKCSYYAIRPKSFTSWVQHTCSGSTKAKPIVRPAGEPALTFFDLVLAV